MHLPDAALPALEQVADPVAMLERVRGLESQLENFILTDVQRIRELAVLNRLADNLLVSRSPSQILADAAHEAEQISRAKFVWVLSTDSVGQIGQIVSAKGQSMGPETLPQPVFELAGRVVREKPLTCLIKAGSDSQAKDTYVGMSILAKDQMVGVLVMLTESSGELCSPHVVRLLQTMLQQTGIAYENVRLFQLMSSMVVDVVIAMALAIESRDPYTGGHVMRVTAYAVKLGQEMGLDKQSLDILRLGGLLHDIGKVALPDSILKKPGSLTDQEFDAIKQHPVVGDRIINPIPQLNFTHDIIRHHHERYDGKGYPDGLAGENIPPLARVMAVADTFDAMVSDRPYRKGLEFEDAMEEIKQCAGTQFDQTISSLFLQLTPTQLSQSIQEMQDWRQLQHRAQGMDMINLINLAGDSELQLAA